MKNLISDIKAFNFTRGANLILTAGLSVLLFDVIYIIRWVFFSAGEERLRSLVLLPVWAEYIFTSLVLVVGGGLFYDYIVKKSKVR